VHGRRAAEDSPASRSAVQPSGRAARVRPGRRGSGGRPTWIRARQGTGETERRRAAIPRRTATTRRWHSGRLFRGWRIYNYPLGGEGSLSGGPAARGEIAFRLPDIHLAFGQNRTFSW